MGKKWLAEVSAIAFVGVAVVAGHDGRVSPFFESTLFYRVYALPLARAVWPEHAQVLLFGAQVIVWSGVSAAMGYCGAASVPIVELLHGLVHLSIKAWESIRALGWLLLAIVLIGCGSNPDDAGGLALIVFGIGMTLVKCGKPLLGWMSTSSPVVEPVRGDAHTAMSKEPRERGFKQ